MPVQFCSQWRLQITNSRSTPETEHNTDKDACLSAAALAGFSSRQEPAAFNIYTQLEWQMYRNFTHTHPLFPLTHLETVCISVCVFFFFFCLLGDRVWFFDKNGRGRAQLQHKQSEISIAAFHLGVSEGDRCGWLQVLKSFILFFLEGGGGGGRWAIYSEFLFSGEGGGWNADLLSKLWQLRSQWM